MAELTQLDVDKVKPSKFQSRESFDEKSIEELAKSIDKYGLMHPILVRPAKGAVPYEIVHGERRWRAVRKLAKPKILGQVRQLDDLEARLAGLIENIQREDLKPPELARAVKELRDLGLSVNEICKRLDKDEKWMRELIGYEEEATPPLRRAVERYYAEKKGAQPLHERTVEKNPLPAVPMRTAVEIIRVTDDLKKAEKKVIQEKFASAIAEADLSLPDATTAVKIWEEKKGKLSPEKAVRIVKRRREEELESAADIVWVQFDEELQDGIKLVMARNNLPSVRDTVIFLVKYALEEMKIIKSRR
jgi:ParB/RepB/Spo0J family partition protein